MREEHVVPDIATNQNNEEEEAEPTVQKIFRAMWESKSNPEGRWFYRTNCQMANENEYFSQFIFKCFTSDCGAFQTTLDVFVSGWMKMLQENAGKITALFHCSCCWKEGMNLQRNLSFFVGVYCHPAHSLSLISSDATTDRHQLIREKMEPSCHSLGYRNSPLWHSWHQQGTQTHNPESCGRISALLIIRKW